ncbi:MAG: hypothetical protein AB7O97_04095 [Planctomycetota bacterium]
MLRLAVLGCCAASLAAQQVARTAHPQDTLVNGGGNLAPLGVFPTGIGAEARTQLLLRSVELPASGAVLTGIEVHCPGTLTMTYQALTITVARTTQTGLGNTFAANLAAPVVVLQGNGLSVPYVSGSWSVIPLNGSYVHDGFSSLVVEFRKVVSPGSLFFCSMDTPSAPARTDRPPMLYSLGGLGSGVANASVATVTAEPIALRLVWSGVPTMRHRSDIQPSGNHYALGSPVDLVVDGTPGSFFMTGVDLAFQPVPFVLPGVGGRLRVVGQTIGGGTLDANGVGVQTVRIPVDPGLVGVKVVYQGGVFDALTRVGTFTNGHDHFVNQ